MKWLYFFASLFHLAIILLDPDADRQAHIATGVAWYALFMAHHKSDEAKKNK